MRRATCAAIIVCLLAVLPAVSQTTSTSSGVQSSIIVLPLTGNWREASDIERDSVAAGVQVFYDENTGAVLQLRNDYNIRNVNEISQAFHMAGLNTATPDAAKILMANMFQLPPSYQKAINDKIHDGRVPKMWDVKDSGNPQWFYVSQLFGGYKVSGGGNASEIREEYSPLRVTKAEHRAAGRGDALIFEAETDRGAPDVAIKRFKLPANIKDQKLRYGWIQYSPGGMTGSESIISLAFAAPASAGFDVNSVLELMVKNYGTKAEAKN